MCHREDMCPFSGYTGRNKPLCVYVRGGLGGKESKGRQWHRGKYEKGSVTNTRQRLNVQCLLLGSDVISDQSGGEVP